MYNVHVLVGSTRIYGPEAYIQIAVMKIRNNFVI